MSNPTINQVFSYLLVMNSFLGKDSISKKHEVFKSCLQHTEGKILLLFNPVEKLKLKVNKAIIELALKSQYTGITTPITIQQLIKTHKAVIASKGAGSTNIKINLISSIYHRVDSIYHPFLIDYYTKTMFKIGYSLATITNLLVQMYPERKNDILTGVETGTPYYDIYINCASKETIIAGNSIKPMLASTHVVDPLKKYLVEVKLDGIRLLFKYYQGEYSCWTRSGLFLDPMSVLDILPSKDKTSILKIEKDFVLDGELWVPRVTSGEGFRLILPIIKSKKKTKIKAYYNIFDLPYYQVPMYTKPLIERKKLLTTLKIRSLPYTQFIPSKLDALMGKFKNSIYEGVVLKEMSSVYEPGKRSTKWIKLKPNPETIDVLITGAQKGTGKYAGHYASFDISVYDDTSKPINIGQVGSGFTKEELEDISKRYDRAEQIIIEISAEALTNTGALRFPRFIRIREDKTKPNTVDELKEFMN